MKPPIKHDENRERDVQALSKAIYETPPMTNHKNRYICPFCFISVGHKNISLGKVMPQLSHNADCPWKIAERLYAGKKA